MLTGTSPPEWQKRRRNKNTLWEEQLILADLESQLQQSKRMMLRDVEVIFCFVFLDAKCLLSNLASFLRSSLLVIIQFSLFFTVQRWISTRKGKYGKHLNISSVCFHSCFCSLLPAFLFLAVFNQLRLLSLPTKMLTIVLAVSTLGRLNL